MHDKFTAIVIRDEHISDQPSKLQFTTDHIKDCTKRNIRITKHGVDEPLFSINPKSWSSSSRREVQDGSGLPIVDIRGSIASKSKVWFCQLPGEQSGPSARRGRHILEASPLGWMSHAIDVRLNGAHALSAANGDSDPVLLQVRGQEHTSRIITRVIYDGQHIAWFRRFQLDERSTREDWFRVLEATVAPNVNLTLIALIGVMLSDLLAEGVKLGDEWMNPRPNESILAMSRRDWQGPPLRNNASEKAEAVYYNENVRHSGLSVANQRSIH